MSQSKPSALYIAFHYPPILGSSGVHRTLAFTRHLDENGWHVRVLTASLKAYHSWSEEQFSFIPENVKVIRAFARDVSRHFSWRGKYFQQMALPDNWQSWILGGIVSGLISIIRRKPDVIISTYPIASAHIIGYVLHRLSGVPWVADMRDPMAQENYPSDAQKKKIYEWIERKIVQHCSIALVTAPGAKALYQQRFPEIAEDFWQIVPNGYDEAIFRRVDGAAGTSNNGRQLEKQHVLLHSGVIYPYERDPTRLFEAISDLKREGKCSVGRLQLRLRATGNDEFYRTQIGLLDIADIVKLEEPVSYIDALKEMLSVDGLLLLQADNCNYQIPAKAYEYIRAQKPVLALTPEVGDTGQLLLNTLVAKIAPLDDKEGIKIALLQFLEELDSGQFELMDRDLIRQYSRQYQAVKFQALLESIVET